MRRRFTMEFGVRLPAAGAKVSPENIVTVARWAEELGYHSLWVSDHVALPDPDHVISSYPYSSNRWPYPADTNWLDPLLALAWAAAVAPSVKLSNSVMVVPLRNPILLAKQLSSLDFLTGGRVMLGVGVGWMKEEFDLIGAPFSRRGARTIEMIELMRALWTGETVDFQGEFYQVSGCKMHPPPAQPTIPIVWGGHSDAALRRVAQVGDGWHPLQNSLEQLAEGLQKLRQLCEEYGRDPDSVLVVVRPGKAYPINAETHARHHELGIQHMVVDPPLDGPNLAAFREEMERLAEVCGLQGRG
jgi:probable F420-dependent oxidoreductase